MEKGIYKLLKPCMIVGPSSSVIGNPTCLVVSKIFFFKSCIISGGKCQWIEKLDPDWLVPTQLNPLRYCTLLSPGTVSYAVDLFKYWQRYLYRVDFIQCCSVLHYLLQWTCVLFKMLTNIIATSLFQCAVRLIIQNNFYVPIHCKCNLPGVLYGLYNIIYVYYMVKLSAKF